MSTVNRIHGYAGQVEIDSVVAASLNKWNLNITHDDAEVTSFNDGNKKYVRGLPDYQGSIAGHYDLRGSSPAEGNAALFDAIEGMDDVDLKLLPKSTDSSNYWTGGALLSGSVDVDVKGAVSLQAQFKPSTGTDWSRVGQ